MLADLLLVLPLDATISRWAPVADLMRAEVAAAMALALIYVHVVNQSVKRF
jgi:hypothetical protein